MRPRSKILRLVWMLSVAMCFWVFPEAWLVIVSGGLLLLLFCNSF